MPVTLPSLQGLDEGDSMHPIYDVDVLLLLATALSAKRRPAELVEIMAALDVLHGSIPPEPKLIEAFERLARHGLLCAVSMADTAADTAAYTLTPAAEKIMVGQRNKADTAQRIQVVKENLAAYTLAAESEPLPVVVTEDQFKAALAAHRAAARAGVRNLLVPKPKADDKKGRPGQRARKAGGQRRPGAVLRRKDAS